jgi:mannitol-1-phosphate 5-dehydrogenase
MTPAVARQALIIGPGRIGCGYLAPLFADAGWDVVLAARTARRAAMIEAAGDLQVRCAGDPCPQRVSVRAVPIAGEAFTRAACEADLIATAVGARRLTGLAVPLARALAARAGDAPVDVWTVENGDVAPVLAAAVRRAAAGLGLTLPPVGFAGAIAEVVVAHGDWKRSARPVFVGDGWRRMLVDETALLTALPRLPGVTGTGRYRERLLEKAVGFSAGHMLCAYLGALRGHRLIDRAVADPQLRPLIQRSLLQARTAFLRAHALDDEVEGPVELALERYADARLGDPVARVARDPVRKLAPEGPLVAPARLVLETTLRVPAGFAVAIAGALLYRSPDDPHARRLAELMRLYDVAEILEKVSGLRHDDPLAREVVRLHSRLRRTVAAWAPFRRAVAAEARG